MDNDSNLDKKEETTKVSFLTKLCNFFKKVGGIIKKSLKYLWAPIAALVTYLVIKKRVSLNKEIKEIESTIQEDKTEIKENISKVEKAEEFLEKNISDIKNKADKISSDQEIRNNKISDFLPGLKK